MIDKESGTLKGKGKRDGQRQINEETYIENEKDPWEGSRNVRTTMHAERGKKRERLTQGWMKGGV